METEISDVDSTNEDEFNFETDYVALRGNKDYSDMLKYIISLEISKIKAVKDIETLDSIQSKALSEPMQFVDDFKRGTMELPTLQILPEMPSIDWSKYGMDDPSEFQLKRETQTAEIAEQFPMVRGRVFMQHKPVTFNQLWTCEEQRRLEELLEVYPEEEVEIRRWEKIANALGNRTTTQVMSRTQKYFMKLAQAGLPIPGRAPKTQLSTGPRPLPGRSQRHKQYKKTTFFPEQHVPVMMDDDYAGLSDPSGDSADTKWQKLALLRSAREQRTLDEISPVVQPITIICLNCQKNGFPGARWICEEDADNVWCTDCVIQCVPLFDLKPIRSGH